VSAALPGAALPTAAPAAASAYAAAGPAPRVVVLGIGNTLLSDEALGIEAVARFGAAYRVPDNVLLIDGGTSAMDLLDVVAGCDVLIVVDAVLAGKAPGAYVRLAGEQVPVFFRTKLSPHQVGLSDLLASLEFAGQLPTSTVILGIEPADMHLGLELTPAVQARMPDLVEAIAAELRATGIEPARGPVPR
jgi:hydrogenase maturation protease